MKRTLAIAAAVMVIGGLNMTSPAQAACGVSRLECTYECTKYYPNGVDCLRTKKVCVNVCKDYDVDISGPTPHIPNKRK